MNERRKIKKYKEEFGGRRKASVVRVDIPICDRQSRKVAFEVLTCFIPYDSLCDYGMSNQSEIASWQLDLSMCSILRETVQTYESECASITLYFHC